MVGMVVGSDTAPAGALHHRNQAVGAAEIGQGPGAVLFVKDVTRETAPAMRILDDVIKTIQSLHQPVIGAINGAAIGGGFCLSPLWGSD